MYGIEEARNDLLASVEELTDEQLNARVEEGRWTIAQVLDHLYLMERRVTEQTSKVLRDEDNEPASRKKPIENTLDRNFKVEAPTPVQPSEDFLSRNEITGKLYGSREQLLALVNGTDQALLTEKSARHPAFGTMDLAQWIEFVGLHERRHLQQIEELKGKL
ncbi:MAG TPA: DinB family protein [Bacillales bacterium]|nr:DinB family protein [Bacillales bacterium]